MVGKVSLFVCFRDITKGEMVMKKRLIIGVILCIFVMLSVVIYELRAHENVLNRLTKPDELQPEV